MSNAYSFQEVVVTISHPSLGVLSTNGQGMGSVSVNPAAEGATITVASDGTPVVNKIKNKTGNIELEVMQTSELHRDLKRWRNYLETAKASEFALMKVVVTSKSTGEQDICTNCTLPQHPGKNFGPEVSNVTWSILSGNIDQNIA